uniref:Flavinylation-associated cytochrome domain-containing protein n=1 Tax=Desulfovibrio sp. U5L TaxID=596152 RepID=I2PZ86_9BACT
MLKKAVSLLLFFSLFLMALTSLVVFIEPSARVASWANWSFLGLSRRHWEGAHLGMGLLFLLAGLAHVALNWDGLLGALRDDDGVVVVFTKPFYLALGLALLVFVGSLAGAPPISQLVSLSGYIKERAVETYGEPPYTMAENSTLEDLARRMGMDGDKALALLRLKNIKAENASLTLAQIARQNGVAPGGVFEALKMVMEPSAGTQNGLPKDPPPGLGRRRLSDICEEYGLDQAATMARLQAAGLKAQPSWTLADVAKSNNVLPIAVYEALRAEKPQTSVTVEVAPAPAESSPQPPAPTVPQQPAAPTHAAPQPAPAAPAPPVAAQPAVPPVQPAQPAPYPSAVPAPQPGYGLPQAPPAQPAAPAQPGYTQAQPGYTQAQPGYTQAQPGYTQAQPGYTQAQPGYTQAPAAVAPAPHAPIAPPPGLEKMMLQTFCREYDIPLSVAVQRLARHRVTAFGDMTFEELALENNRTPVDIMHMATSQ